MDNPSNPKERNLIKGALRRVFSRSELRRKALDGTRIEHKDESRPRVTKWSWCTACGVIEPTYLMEIDHRSPLVPIGSSLEDMTWDEVVNRLWCSIDNLQSVCKSCHTEKSKLENTERRLLKKGKIK